MVLPPSRPSAGLLFARLVLVGLGLVGHSTASRAQAVDAAILGGVRDGRGVQIAGAAVTARNSETGVEWTLRTTSTGQFAFLRLPLGGPYSVTVRRPGFRPAQHDGYLLALGTRVVLDLVLDRAVTELAPVVVEANGTERHLATAGANYRVDAEQLKAVPALNRNFTDLAALAPTTGAQSSLLGQRWTSTDIRIDGAQARNMLRAGELGAGPFTLSMEAVREFDVSSTVYDVTQGRQGGGAVRAATKAGTNTWTGSAFTYYRGSSLSAAADFQARSRAQRQFDAVQWGGSVGGPLVSDRLHLFLAVDRVDSNEPLFTGQVSSADDERAAGIARDSLARLLSILATQYSLDTTRAQVGRLDRRPVANTAFLRLDWSPSGRHRLTLTNNYTGWMSPLSGGVDQPITLFDARSNYRTHENLSLATLRSTFATGLQHELRVGVASSSRALTPTSPAPRGFVRVQSQLAGGTRGDVRIQFGGNRLAPDDSRELQLQLANVANLQRGNVLWTAGTDNSLTRTRTSISEAQSGLFEFNSLAELEARRPTRYSRTLPLVERAPATRQHVLELGAFAQAEWRPSMRLAVTTGLRWDGSAFLTAPPRNALVEQVLSLRTDRAPADWTRLAPRAQVVWDLSGIGRDVLRIGAGRFSAQAPYYVQHNQLLNDGTRIADITLTGAAVPIPDYTAYRADPATIPGLPVGASAPAPYVNVVDAHFRNAGIWKASATYRRRLSSWLALTGTALGSWTADDYMYLDRNLRTTPAFTLDAEGDRAVFVPASMIDAQGRTLNVNALASRALGRVLALTNAGRGRQHAGIVEADVALPRGGVARASYTYNRALDNTTFGCCLARTATTFTAVQSDPRDLAGSWGPSDTDFRQKLVLAGSLRLRWGILLGGRYVGTTGRPFSAVVNGDINGDEAISNDLAFVFDPDDPSTPLTVAASMRRVLDNPRNVARGYLRDHLGHIASRNGAAVPWTARIDLRLAKTLRTARGQSAEVGLDVFNFANLLNSAWGAEALLPAGISNQNPVVQRVPLLNVVGFDQATRRYLYTVNENFGVLQRGGTPYQAQLAVRYRF